MASKSVQFNAPENSLCARVKVPTEIKLSHFSFTGPFINMEKTLPEYFFSSLSVGCTLDCLHCVGDDKINDVKGISRRDVYEYIRSTGGLLSVRMS